MRVSRDFCKQQLGRLSVAPLYAPKTPEAIVEWLDAMERVGRSEEQVKKAISDLLETRDCRNPLGEFVYLCRASKPPLMFNY